MYRLVLYNIGSWAVCGLFEVKKKTAEYVQNSKWRDRKIFNESGCLMGHFEPLTAKDRILEEHFPLELDLSNL